MRTHVPLALLLAGCLACGGGEAPAETDGDTASDMTAPAIDAARLLDHIRTLSSDEFEGRAPGGRGEPLTVDYLIDQFRTLGLQPGNTDGTYVQRVPLVGITADADLSLTFRNGSQQRELISPDDFVAWTKRVTERAGLDASELVFVGYGVQAPEFDWDDYKGLDVTGKTLVMLVNDPPVPDPADSGQLDPATFGGRAMTYYGRWTYKFEVAAALGAAGAFVVHETGPAGYPYDVVKGSTGEQFDLVTPDKNMSRVAVEGWMTLDQARALLAMSGQDFDALKQVAATRAFTPVSLGTTASIAVRNTLRTIDSQNVLARLEGSDPALEDELVVYTAHWDHLGRGEPVEGDDIFNGAVDNASGTAGLIELARAFASLETPPKRSILFLAVTAEEQGLLGSQYYAAAPVYPLARTLADINIDGLNVYGRTRDIIIIGLGFSELDELAERAAAAQGRVLRGDLEPEKGFYYRSDHFHFAKLGVPSYSFDGGDEFIDKPPDYGQRVRAEWNERFYHTPRDQVREDWDLSGAVEDLQFHWMLGYQIAQAERYPEWRPGTEFKAIRDASLRTAGGEQ